MDETVRVHIEKFKLLFEKVVEGGCELDRHYTDALLALLNNSEADSPEKKLLENPWFPKLTEYALTNLDRVPVRTRIFFIEIFTIAFRHEVHFSKLQQMDRFDELLFNMYKNNMDNVPPDLHMACINVALAQFQHCSGTIWLNRHKMWRYFLRDNLHRKSAKVARAIYDFMAELVFRLELCDQEPILLELLGYIIEPLKTSKYQTLEELHTENEMMLMEPLIPFLSTLLAVISKTGKVLKSTKAISLITRYFLAEAPLHIMYEVTRDAQACILLGELVFRYYFIMKKDVIVRKDLNELSNEIPAYYYNNTQILLNKRMIMPLLSVVANCNIIYSKLGDVVPHMFERDGQKFEIQTQFSVLLIVPLIIYCKHNLTSQSSLDSISALFIKLCKVMTEHSVKSAYSVRDVMRTCDERTVAIEAIKQVFRVKENFSATSAGIMYQCLYYILLQYVQCDDNGVLLLNENKLNTPDDVKMLSLTLDAIKMLLTEYNLNWYETVEIITLQSTLVNMIKLNILPTKQLLKTMDLIDLCIKNFLSPDLHLLVESKSGSALNEIGLLMKSHIQHDEWEIRESALSLLLTCTDIAFVKYISLRKLISENELMQLAVHAALNDPEYYVQITAIKCVAAASKLECVWKEVLAEHKALLLQLPYIMIKHQEGLVRKEAAKALREIYTNQKLSDAYKKYLYKVFATAAMEDLHWEVQVAALIFWCQVMTCHFSNRGMIDGKFPLVTFSKEKRKIIALNEKEITNQLIGILNELSASGCLAVIHKCLKEDYHIKVAEIALCLVNKLMNVLDKNNFRGVPEEEASPVMNVEENHCNGVDNNMDISYSFPMDYEMQREQVIDSILNTKHSDLIEKMYEDYTEIKTDPMELHNLNLKSYEVLSPYVFLKDLKETDYKTIIEAKKKYNSGVSDLSAVLDELLGYAGLNPDVEPECFL